MPVSEQEVVAALPPGGWLRRYVIHGLKQTTAPLVYHLGMGVTLLGATCPLAYGMHYAGTLRACNFTMLVGRSGEDQKTSALRVAKEILKEAAPPLIGENPASPEGLIASLENRPSQILFKDEFGEFLATAKKSYYEPIKQVMNDLWDCSPQQRIRAKGPPVRVENPRFSIATACALNYLEDYMSPSDWMGGFFGRWFVLYGVRERIDPNPIGDRSDFQWLVDQIRLRATTPDAGWCDGLEPAAENLWNEWFTDVSNRSFPTNSMGLRSRSPTICRKIALIYGWDFGLAPEGKPWLIDLSILEPAIKATELHIKSVLHLNDVIAEHEDARLRREVMQAIMTSPTPGIASLGQILGILKRRRRIVMEILDALMVEGRVKKVQTTLGFVYELHSTGSLF